jgi:hypothetical protein
MKWIGAHIFDYISRFRNDVHVDAKILDSSGSAGSSGDILTSTGTTVAWSDAAVTYNTVATYTHTHSAQEHTWVIEHNLGKYPSVTVIDSGDSVVVGEVTYNTSNKLTITFYSGGALSAFGGKAYLN